MISIVAVIISIIIIVWFYFDALWLLRLYCEGRTLLLPVSVHLYQETPHGCASLAGAVRG